MKDGRLGKCKKCHSEYGAQYYSSNKSKMNKSSAKWRENNKQRSAELISAWQKNNPSKCNASTAKWEKANKPKIAETAKKYRQNNKAKITEKRRLYYLNNKESLLEKKRKWNKENNGARIAHAAKRRAAKLSATPAWANSYAIKEIYQLSSAITELMEPTHVDHIVPLQGKNVCGLHVEYNLQILKASDNVRKSNHHD